MLWGSDKTDTRGRILEKIILEQDLILLNDLKPTHFSIANGTFSTIYLSFCSTNIALNCECNTMSDLNDSDHFPILIKIHTNQPENHDEPTPRWKLDYADWGKYQRLIETNILPLDTLTNSDQNNIENLIKQLISIMKHAADNSIPKTAPNTNRKHNTVPWWNKECETATKEAKHAFNRHKKHPTTENLIKFKKLRAIARKTIRQKNSNR
ncbi:uncharacterized protein LOC144467694 [Augochlora pura]